MEARKATYHRLSFVTMIVGSTAEFTVFNRLRMGSLFRQKEPICLKFVYCNGEKMFSLVYSVLFGSIATFGRAQIYLILFGSTTTFGRA